MGPLGGGKKTRNAVFKRKVLVLTRIGVRAVFRSLRIWLGFRYFIFTQERLLWSLYTDDPELMWCWRRH